MKTKIILIALVLLSFIKTNAQYEKSKIDESKKLGSTDKSAIISTKCFGFINTPSADLKSRPSSTDGEIENDMVIDKEIEKVKAEKLKLKLQSITMRVNGGGENSTQSVIPVIGNNFNGNPNSNSCPLDNTVAISDGGWIVSIANSNIDYYDMNGTHYYTNTIYNLYNDATLSSFVCDPKVIYDSYSDRFIFYSQTCDAISADSKIIISFSATNNPNDGWHVYEFTGNPLNNNSWWDYPKMAVSTDELFITGNLVIQGNTYYDQSVIYQMDKNAGYSGLAINWAHYTGISGSPSVLLPVSYGQAGGYGPGIYLVSSSPGGGSTIKFYDITNNLSNSPVLNYYSINVPSYSVPANAPQLGGTYLLNTGDCRMQSGFYLNGIVHCVFNFDVSSGSGWGGIDYHRITAATLADDSRGFGSYPNFDYTYPSIASYSLSSTDKSVMIGFDRSGSSTYPEIRVVNCDDGFNWSGSTLVRQGDSYIGTCYDAGRNAARWGDYSGMSRKHNSTSPSVWMNGSYGNSSNYWSTWIAEIHDGVAACTTPSTPMQTDYNGVTEASAVFAYTLTPTLTWTNVGASCYYVYIRNVDTGVLLPTQGPIFGTSYTVTTGLLVDGTNYRWNVMADANCDGVCQSAIPSAVYFFTCNCPIACVAASSISSSSGTTICSGQSTTLTPVGGTTGSCGSWVWYTGSCNSSAVFFGSSYTVNPTSTTTYFVNPLEDCRSTIPPCASITITVNTSLSTTPNIQASGSTTLCNGNSVTLSVTNQCSGCTYSWSNGGSGTSIPVSSAGTYTCRATNSCGIISSISNSIIVTVTNVNVTANAASNPICFPGGSSVLTASGATSYFWSPSTGLSSSTGAQVTFTPTSTGAFTFTVTGTTNICTATAQVTVTVNTVPTAVSVSGAGTFCGSTTLTASGGTSGTIYWQNMTNGGMSTANSTNPQTVTQSGTYYFRANNSCGWSTQGSATVTINPPVIVSIPNHTDVLCFGLSSGSAAATATGGSGGYTYSWSPSGGTGATANNLSAETYTVTVTSGTCTGTQTVTINQPPAINANIINSSNVSCFGGTDGSATVSANGGTGAYTYLWSPNGGTAATANNLAANAFTVTVHDANGCMGSTFVTLTAPPAITFTHSSSAPSGCGIADGTASVIVSGGTPGYTYSWSPAGGTAATTTGVASGTYICTIHDANNCMITATVVVPSYSSPLNVSITASTNELCNGGNNGSATALANGTSGYSYSWTPSGQTTATAINLTVGLYTCTVTDVNGCTKSDTVTITQPNPLNPTITLITPVSCYGDSNASVTVLSSGGTVPYTYLWSTGAITQTINGLSAVPISVTLTDANGCTAVASVTIMQPQIITSTATHTDVSCFGGSNGLINLTVSGGTLGYTYSWFPSGGTAATANNLLAGTYNVHIIDANGCTHDTSITITQPPLLTATMGTPTNVLCNGGATGSATVTAGGGTGAYTYSWSPSGGTAATANNLAAGNYTVTVHDANNCTATANVTITQPPLLTATMGTPTNVLCNGGATGSATVTAGGGTGAYTYSWSPSGGTAATANNLTAGNYTVTVHDANNCTATANVAITQPPLLTATMGTPINVLCNGGATGSATVTVGGGTGAYTYSWSPSGGTAATANNLIAGNYTVTVRDANNCTATANVAITQPPLLTATMGTPTNVLCNGGATGSAIVTAGGGTGAYTYLWSPSGGTAVTANNLIAGNYTVTVHDANNCTATANVAITQPLAIVLTTNQVSANCGQSNGSASVIATGGTSPYTYLWMPSSETNDTAINLTAGNYTITVTDGNGCVSSATANVGNVGGLTSSISSSTNVLCNGESNGLAVVIATGGAMPYIYSWNTAPVQTNDTAVNLPAGFFTVTVTDANGCVATASDSITEPSILTDTLTFTPSCFGQPNATATSLPTGGTSGYIYLWSPSGQTTPTAVGLSGITYTCVTTDFNGCSISKAILIQVDPPFHPSVILIGDTLSTPPTGIAYQWYYSPTQTGTYLPPIGGNFSQYAIPTNCAFYFVSVTDAYGCMANSDTNYYCVTGIQSPNSSKGISVYPNPNNGIFTVETNSSNDEKLLLKVLNDIGQVIFEKEIIATQNKKFDVDLSRVAKGVYLIQLSGNKTFYSQKLVVE